jgi:hypothetical protein
MREKAAHSVVFEALVSFRILALWPYKLGKYSYRAQCQRVHWSDWGFSHLSAHLCWLVGFRGPHNRGLYNTKFQTYRPSFICAQVVNRDRLSILCIVSRILVFCQGQSVVSSAFYMQHDIIRFACQSMLGVISKYFSGQHFYCTIRRIWL